MGHMPQEEQYIPPTDGALDVLDGLLRIRPPQAAQKGLYRLGRYGSEGVKVDGLILLDVEGSPMGAREWVSLGGGIVL